MNSGGITARQRRLLVLAVGKLTASSTPGEREVIFRRVDEELGKLRLSWSDVFEAGLPRPEEPATPAEPRPDLMSAVDAMMADFVARSRPGPAATGIRHLRGDEIPPTIEGRVVIDEEGVAMRVRIVGSVFSYGPLLVLDEQSQRTARTAGPRTVIGRVDQPDDPDATPTLYGLTLA